MAEHIRQLSASQLKLIIEKIRSISHGEVVLVAQDGVLIQLEVNEKINFSARLQNSTDDWLEEQEEALSKHIQQEFAKLQYGRLSVIVKNGRVKQLERTEKQRFLGLDGEGI